MTDFTFLFYFFSALSCFFFCNALDSENIVGGDYAENDQFKYQISLRVFGKDLCGGSIVADNFILTAAHCVTESDDKIIKLPWKVVAGTNNLNAKGRALEVAVDTIYVHKKHNYRKAKNDIAILKLKQNLDLHKNTFLEKINLPTDNNTYNGKIATVSGYGWTQKTIDGPLIEEGLLKYARVKIIDNNECRQKVTYFKPRASNICGYLVQRGNEPEGICHGDSGSSLVYEKTIIGIVSVSPNNCNENEEPAAYIRVSSYVSFIRDILEGHPTDVIEYTVGAN